MVWYKIQNFIKIELYFTEMWRCDTQFLPRDAL